MSPFPPKVPNPKVNEFIPLGAEELYEEDVKAMMDRRLDGTYQDTWTELFPFSLLYCELILKHEGLQTWLSQQEPFDLIFIDTLFNDCAYGFVHKFKTPFIHISTSTVSMHEPDTAGHVPETSWIPDLQVHFPHDMNFLQRVSNTLRPLVWYFARCWWLFPKLETVLREHLNLTDLPSLCEMDKQASLVFINTHFSIEFARSLPPLYVPIGGLHIQEKLDEKLPKVVRQFLHIVTYE
jgi:glucuronosyltransferase